MTLTSGQVAQFCDVSPKQVCNWMERDYLKGYRLPGSQHRRFDVKDVRDFMVQYKIPTERLDQYVNQQGEGTRITSPIQPNEGRERPLGACASTS